MLALLGWNPGTTQELFSLEELVEAFSLERVSKAGAKFDPDKTKWFQQQYLRAQSDDDLAELLGNLTNGKYSHETLKSVSHLMKERAVFVQDMLVDGAYLLARPFTYDKEIILKKWKAETFTLIQEWLEEVKSITSFDALTIEITFKTFLARKEVGIGAVLLPFRLSVTGVGAGPGMFDIAAFLGKKEVVERIEIGLKAIDSIINEA
jgi:glutamyl-tRNA synthetase